MPRIKLKPNSPEYLDDDREQDTHDQICDMPGCSENATHKAPKDRGLNQYYHFCQDHIREYNQAWNYFEGMSEKDIQDHLINNFYGFRPTWNYGAKGNPEEILRDKAWEFFTGRKEKPEDRKKTHGHNFSSEERQTPEVEALAIMGLEPPVELDEIKLKYKMLAKKYHPDMNNGCQKSEDQLKKINMAYTILKLAYENFETLPERPL